MNVFVNNKEAQIEEKTTLAGLARTLQLPREGVAIAVDNQMIPKAGWDGFILQENARIVIIKAACGG